MSDISSPESATASLTAVSAWAASGISAERVTWENPTPLTATLHRFSHIWPLPFTRTLQNNVSFRDAAQRQARNPYSRGLCLWVPGSRTLSAPRDYGNFFARP